MRMKLKCFFALMICSTISLQAAEERTLGSFAVERRLEDGLYRPYVWDISYKKIAGEDVVGILMKNSNLKEENIFIIKLEPLKKIIKRVHDLVYLAETRGSKDFYQGIVSMPIGVYRSTNSEEVENAFMHFSLYVDEKRNLQLLINIRDTPLFSIPEYSENFPEQKNYSEEEREKNKVAGKTLFLFTLTKEDYLTWFSLISEIED